MVSANLGCKNNPYSIINHMLVYFVMTNLACRFILIYNSGPRTLYERWLLNFQGGYYTKDRKGNTGVCVINRSLSP